jgi:hypothetical protein
VSFVTFCLEFDREPTQRPPAFLVAGETSNLARTIGQPSRFFGNPSFCSPRTGGAMPADFQKAQLQNARARDRTSYQPRHHPRPNPDARARDHTSYQPRHHPQPHTNPDFRARARARTRARMEAGALFTDHPDRLGRRASVASRSDFKQKVTKDTKKVAVSLRDRVPMSLQQAPESVLPHWRPVIAGQKVRS